MDSLLAQYGTLVGVAAAIALIINTLKYMGVVSDGTASNWSAGLNLIALTGLLLLRIFAPSVEIAGVDAQIGQAVEVVAVILGYVLQLFGSKLTHMVVKGLPVVGTSYSG